MKKIFYVLLVLFVIIVFVKPDIYPVSACENQHPTSLFSDKEASIICIDSKNIYDFNDNDPENITIPGHLYFPPNIDSPVSLIIISHGAGGIFRFHYDYKDMMLEHGYAVLIIDHFTPRDTIIDFTFKYVTEPMMVSDVINSAKILRTHPRLNGKIGYIGWSKGGLGPILLKNKHLYDKLVYKNDFEFLAGVYTYCGFDIDKENVTDIPMLLISGNKDKITPASYCSELISKLNDENIEYHILADAYHGFDNYAFFFGSYLPWQPVLNANTDKCLLKINPIFQTVNLNDNMDLSSLKNRTRFLDECTSQGAYVQYNSQPSIDAKKILMKFINKHMPN